MAHQSLKTSILLAGAVLIASPAFSNEARIWHRDAGDGGVHSIRIMTVTQQAGGANRILGLTGAGLLNPGADAVFQGSLDTVTLTQNGQNNATGLMIGGLNASTTSTFSSVVTGDSNALRTMIGTTGGLAPNVADFTYALQATGDGNLIVDSLTPGGTGALSYTGVIQGDGNSISVSADGDGTAVNVAYNIVGAGNDLTVAMAGGAGGRRSSTIDINGNNNDITHTVAAGVAEATLTANYTGSQITSNINQNGTGVLSVTATVTNLLANPLSHTITQNGQNQTVVSTLDALGGGTFTLTQDAASTGALYNDTVQMAVGGTVTINQ